MNAGPLPHHHWLLDSETGGGRLLGEGRHFIDLACFVAGKSDPVESTRARSTPRTTRRGTQSYRIELAFANGDCGFHRISVDGDASLAKERIEIHRSGTSIVIDDFRSASLHRGGRGAASSRASRDKGHRAEVRAFLEAVRTGGSDPHPGRREHPPARR